MDGTLGSTLSQTMVIQYATEFFIMCPLTLIIDKLLNKLPTDFLTLYANKPSGGNFDSLLMGCVLFGFFILSRPIFQFQRTMRMTASFQRHLQKVMYLMVYFFYVLLIR